MDYRGDGVARRRDRTVRPYGSAVGRRLGMVALMLLLIWLGVYPSPMVSPIRSTALHVVNR